MGRQVGTAAARLASDLEGVVEDAERLVSAVGREGGEKVDLARARLVRQLVAAREELARFQHGLGRQARVMARRADLAVHEHPWTTAAVAAGVGAAVGILVALLTERR